MFVRRLLFERVKNVRDLGGYATLQRGSTVFGRFLRSGVTSKLSDEEIKYLLRYGVRTVIDLREKNELARKPNAFQNVEQVKFFNIPLYDRDVRADISPDILFSNSSSYLKIVNNLPKMNEVFSTMIDNIEGVTLFNCQLGRDRTGVIAALLLMLANVSPDDIVVDYAISYINIDKLLKIEARKDYDLPMHFLKIEQVINFIKIKYGTIIEYFFAIGLSYEDIIKLKNKLVLMQ